MRTLLTVVCLLIALGVCSSAPAQNWTRFRGPDGTGISDLKGVPSSWTINDYAWNVDLPGTGHSSPIVWGKSLFVTSAEEDGARHIFCLDADTGAEKWRHTSRLGKQHLHKMNSWASGTPTTDGDRVYIAFADDDHYTVTAYTMDGAQAWTRDLGSCITEHGHGVSPILFGDLVIVCNDQGRKEGPPPSLIFALNRKTGETVWTVERKSREASYATPIIITPPDKAPQLVVMSGAHGMSGLDPLTGQELWSSGEVPMRTVGSPAYGDGLLVATCGSGGRGDSMICVSPGAAGEAGSQPLRYVRPKTQGVPYVPTPIIQNGRIYLWNDDGTFFLASLADGKNLTRQRIGGQFFASPVLLEGRLFNVSHEGEIVVISLANDEVKIEGRNPLGDSAYASPAVANGGIYFRGFKKLAFLKARS
ncbi:outer membrane biogenesis protein BamB [Caulifigura coniformis]|uniref:Outer membrane biogenesis protein BamB n=1 Tax=Caulifigura coniformis TaxID=2527983 RepID=A0A517SBW7_9PLAN|nr:PQQ-binding-like beta-propeller repeat protein [Caulifigura coniformis]QDT53586.1 outer membrane biogenesis protein BamB [Caulifigura coniformis]